MAAMALESCCCCSSGRTTAVSSQLPPLDGRSVRYVRGASFPRERWSCQPFSPRARLVIKARSRAMVSAAAAAGKNSKKKAEVDAWESLFEMLEKDLENDSEDLDNEELGDTDLLKLENELNSVFENLEGVTSSADAEAVNEDIVDGFSNTEDEDTDYDDDDLEDKREVRLEKWQLRKLAAAARIPRRKVNIKSLVGETGLDRKDVLYFLKEPPPELLMLADNEEIGEEQANKEPTDDMLPENAIVQEFSLLDVHSSTNSANKKETIEKKDWVKGKRFRKEHIAAFELVYGRTKRPTNTMIQDLVKLTNLPRRRIVQWFDEKRYKSRPVTPVKSRKRWRREVTDTFARRPS